MLEILFRNQDFAAVSKPAGIAVHQEEGADNLLAMAAARLNVPRLWLTPRLDKPTSGVLLLALNAQAASELAQQFAAKTMRKTYLALATDKPSKKQGWIKGDMEKSRRGAWKLTRGMENPAVTEFGSHSLEPGLRLFVLHPHTGKTHQLRVAMKSLGSPILGDTLYGGKPASRMFLHSWKIKFDYQDQAFEIVAPLSEEWPPLDFIYE